MSVLIFFFFFLLFKFPKSWEFNAVFICCLPRWSSLLQS